MAVFDKVPKLGEHKTEKIKKNFSIDDRLYDKLQYLIDNVYDVSINKLVKLAIEELIKTENVILYETNYKIYPVSRTFSIDEVTYNKLLELKEKYEISLYKLVNISIYNILSDPNIKQIIPEEYNF